MIILCEPLFNLKIVCFWPKKMVGVTLLVLAIVTAVEGHGTYVPKEACTDMWPKGHDTQAQTNESPYVISINSTTYTPGAAIEVFVNTTGAHDIDFFEGILLQVRHAVGCDHKDVNNKVGTYQLEDGEDFLNQMTCSNPGDTIAHKVHAHIYNRTFIWMAPNDLTGPVFIKATIARRQKTFWTNVHSAFIIDSSNPYTDPEVCVDKADIPHVSMFLVLCTSLFMLFT